MKKYKLTENKITFLGKTLYQIESLIDFGDVRVGDKGGYIEKEENLSHYGNCWVYGAARVCGNARVCGDAIVCGNSDIVFLSKIGKEYDYSITAFRNKEGGVLVTIGDFIGKIDELTEKYFRNTDEYNAVVNLIKVRFEVEE